MVSAPAASFRLDLVSFSSCSPEPCRDPSDAALGSIPGWPGAHSQEATLDEVEKNLREVIEMLLEDGDPKLESEFVGLQTIQVT